MRQPEQKHWTERYQALIGAVIAVFATLPSAWFGTHQLKQTLEHQASLQEQRLDTEKLVREEQREYDKKIEKALLEQSLKIQRLDLAKEMLTNIADLRGYLEKLSTLRFPSGVPGFKPDTIRETFDKSRADILNLPTNTAPCVFVTYEYMPIETEFKDSPYQNKKLTLRHITTRFLSVISEYRDMRECILDVAKDTPLFTTICQKFVEQDVKLYSNINLSGWRPVNNTTNEEAPKTSLDPQIEQFYRLAEDNLRIEIGCPKASELYWNNPSLFS